MGEGGGGRREELREFYLGRLHPEAQTLTLLYTIFNRKVALSIALTSIDKWYRFHMPSLEKICQP